MTEHSSTSGDCRNSVRAMLRQAARVAQGTSAKDATSASAFLVTRVATTISRANPSLLPNKQYIRTQLRAFSSVVPVNVPVPSMGNSISEGVVVEWLKNPGDSIAAGEVVVILDTGTDNVAVDVRAPFCGTLVKQLASSNESVSVGAPPFHIAKGDVTIGQAGSKGHRDWRFRFLFAAGCVSGGLIALYVLLYAILHAIFCRVDDDLASILVEESLGIIETNEKVASHLGTPLVGHEALAIIRHRDDRAKIEDEDAEPSSIYLMYKLIGPKGDATVLAEVAKDKYNHLVVVFDDTNDFVKIFEPEQTPVTTSTPLGDSDN